MKMWIIDAVVDTFYGWHLDIKRCLGLVPFPEQKQVEKIVNHEDLDVCVDSKEFYFVNRNGENAFESEEALEDDRNGIEVTLDITLPGKGLKKQNHQLIDISETDSDHIGKEIRSEIILTETQENNLNAAISRECQQNIVDHDKNKRNSDRSDSENLQVELQEDKRKPSDEENIIENKEVTNHTELVTSRNYSKLKEEVKNSNSVADTGEYLTAHQDNRHTDKKDDEEIKPETKKDPLGLETSVNETVNKRSCDRKNSETVLRQSETVYEQPKSLTEIVSARIRDFEIHGVRSCKYLYRKVSP